MREKRSIKLRTDMYEDTKFKIIDTMDDRDTINYIWTRLLTLCGKINDAEGRLYVTRNMPYTIEILALEFNRTKEQVENAIRVFSDLNMVCRDEKGVLKVCNWNKYQGGSRKSSDKDEKKELILKEEKLEQDREKRVINDNKVKDSDVSGDCGDKSKRDNKDIVNSTNIIDITNGDLVKDKNAGNKIINKETDIKSKRRAKKKSGKSNNIITYDEDDDSGDIIYFTEGEPVSDPSDRIAVFNFE